MRTPLKLFLPGMAALLLAAPFLTPTTGSDLYAADLSYPPPGSSIRFVDKRHGEHNTPSHIDRLDVRSDQSSHTIIQPGYRPYRSDNRETVADSVSPRVEVLNISTNNEAPRTGRPLIWKIDSPGTASNYIMGTIHLDDERIMDLSDTVLTRLRSADRLMLELDLDQRTSLDIMRKMIFTDGRTLQQVIGEDLFSDLSEHIRHQSGLPSSMLSVLKPWAAMVILLRPDNDSGTFLDKQLSKIARNDSIPVIGLETVDEQLSAFDRIALDDQALLLRSTIDELDDKDSVYRQLLDAYIEGDLDRIVQVSAESEPKDERLAALFKESLILRRNKHMYQRMLPSLQQGNTFVAIGALHLPGEQGLLAMLKRQGYTLTRLSYGM
ncbi:MAG TPA: hypothetical protein DDW55_12685 [Gammaproteobacteria bacterium]|nr:hypothetical protein [Gammaproteobacteria bacterium]